MGPSVAKASQATRTQANRLRAVRVAAGLSQRALASAAGVSRLTIQRTERGDTLPTVPTLFCLAAALAVPVEELLAPEDAAVLTAQREAVA